MKKSIVVWPLTLISLMIVGLGLFAEADQWRLILIGMSIIAGLGFMDIYTPKIAQLSESNPKVKTMRRLNRLFILFFTAVFSFLIWFPAAESLLTDNEYSLAFITTLSIMGIIGNTAPKLPFNRYMGLRLPWTVRDEATWKAAHKWLGYITFPIILVMIIAYFLNIELEEIVKYGILSWIAIPGLYSGWIYYKRMG
ncbi:SdpI/YhfL protein family protein [Alkalibacterium subtropicum]|uniref:SdpI/YhfL protein family protein n=1 Tax=Alkalibacterium subtropicum TaxID=753702 RepID=A0A1I1IIK0_9LACT|nr:SdpI family protein [Alkalibacterium subtropicum]SFC36104.1 SdpI/YhfL protein family protein [Alkalibacterium subtropicum]